MASEQKQEMAGYKLERTYKKIPRKAKDFIDAYAEDGDRDKLFKNVKENVATINTMKGRYVRQSEFRSLLRKGFNFTHDDLKPVKFTKAESAEFNRSMKQSVHAVQQTTLNRQHVQGIIDGSSLAYCLCTSGLRYNELVRGVSFRDGVPYVKLSKKDDGGNVANITIPVKIIGDVDKWIENYGRIKRDHSDSGLRRAVGKVIAKNTPDTLHKKSTHLCRAIYARYIYQFMNYQNQTLGVVIENYLNHDNAASAVHYEYIILTPDCMGVLEGKPAVAPMTRDSLLGISVPDLNKLMKDLKLKGRSKARRKDEKIKLILASVGQ